MRVLSLSYTPSSQRHTTTILRTQLFFPRWYVATLSKHTLDLKVSKFMKGVQQMRIYLIDTVRKKASEIFFIDSAKENQYYSANYDRSTIPALTDLLKSPKKPNEQYAMYPRVLFTNYEVVNEELFGSHAILNVSQLHHFTSAAPHDRSQILKVILLRSTSLESSSTQRSGPKGNAHKWRLESVTPGCIAMAAVVVSGLACFYDSLDLTFSFRHSLSFHQITCSLTKAQSPRSTIAIASNSTRNSSSKILKPHE